MPPKSLPTAVASNARRTVQWTVLSENGPAGPRRWDRGRPVEKYPRSGVLLREAMARLSSNTAPATPMDDVMRELGITEEELDAAEDVVIE